jgi:hypothetical protein
MQSSTSSTRQSASEYVSELFECPLEEILAKLLVERLENLERRVAALEAKAVIEYRGVWEAGRQYGRGAAVTDHGALWICEHATSQRPGDGAENGWRLAVKSGHAPPPAALPDKTKQRVRPMTPVLRRRRSGAADPIVGLCCAPRARCQSERRRPTGISRRWHHGGEIFGGVTAIASDQIPANTAVMFAGDALPGNSDLIALDGSDQTIVCRWKRDGGTLLPAWPINQEN